MSSPPEWRPVPGQPNAQYRQIDPAIQAQMPDGEPRKQKIDYWTIFTLFFGATGVFLAIKTLEVYTEPWFTKALNALSTTLDWK